LKLYGSVARFEQLFGLQRLKLAVPWHLEPNRTVAERDGSNHSEVGTRAR
jgi:hypothetical protein